MNIVLYNSFEKRENSTKKPTSQQSSITLSGYLREPCSMINPVFAIKRMTPDITPSPYTYAYIPDYNRYYFVKDWTWREGLWQCELNIDVLATYKTEIGTETHYILRHDSTTDYNGLIADAVYPATNAFTTENTATDDDPFRDIFTEGVAGGVYIVGIISGNEGQSGHHYDSVGAITYYALTSGDFDTLKNTLFGTENLEIMNIIDSQGQPKTNMSPDIMKTMYNPYQYIASCMWFPFNANAIEDKTSVNKISIGWWDYPLTAWRLTAQILAFDDRVTLPAHPQSATRGAYLNYAPYTRRTLLGRFGDIPIDLSYFRNSSELGLEYYVDLINGQCRVFISYIENNYFRRYTSREFLLGVPIQLAQVGIDYMGVAVNTIDTLVNTATDMLSFNPVKSASSLAHGVYNSIQSCMPQLETGGSNGSFVCAYTATRLLSQFFIIVDEDLAHMGRPLYSTRQINTLGGYVLCADGEISLSCLDDERKMISNYLTSGFFWE